MGISMKIDEYECIEELKRLKKLATQGEWISGYVSGKTTSRPVISINRRIICKSPKVYRYGNQHLAACDADMAYIAAACNAVPDLIRCNENLHAQIELLNKVIDCLAQDICLYCVDRENESCPINLQEDFYGEVFFKCRIKHALRDAEIKMLVDGEKMPEKADEGMSYDNKG